MDSKKIFWIGTEGGLLRFNPETGECYRIKVRKASLTDSCIDVRAISETKDGKLWLGLETKGLARINNDGVMEIGYNSLFGLQNVSVRSLLASSDGLLYVGYENGFAIVDPRTEGMKDFYTTHNGLCNNFVGCITEDAKGQIWLGFRVIAVIRDYSTIIISQVVTALRSYMVIICSLVIIRVLLISIRRISMLFLSRRLLLFLPWKLETRR
jgi:ligand-binding sensor domain-containing protein